MTTLPHPKSRNAVLLLRLTARTPLAGAMDGPSPSLAHASPCPAIATCFLPSSIFHSHPSPTPADSTTLNPPF
ncbi:uncharacterized protein IAS62_006591 [Cryptococcus decagattii]|uniref:Uncharacterized protein n=1 Tax=Cryptococcus decagattii TaxID=1859122 RepID=A0ABZ2B6Y9_9TREE